MTIYILDSNFDIIAPVPVFTSLIWDRRYYEPGDRGNEVYYRKRLDAIRDWRAGKREDPPK